MAQFDWQGAWESSYFLTWLLSVWEGSLIYRAITAVFRYIGRVGPHSVVGRIVLSDWPDSEAFSRSLIGRFLLAFNGWVARPVRRAVPFFLGTWESSLFVRAGKAVIRWFQPYFASSFLCQTAVGYAGDTELAPAESDQRTVSPLLPLLGAALGLIALIPSPGEGQGGLNPTILLVLGVWGVAGLWLLAKVFTGDFSWRASSAFVPLLSFLLVAGAATWQSADRAASMQTFILWVTAGLAFFLMVNLTRNTRDVAAFMGPVMVAGVLMALWAMYQFKFPPVVEENWVDPSEGNLVRTFAGMNNPNYLAEFIELYTPIVVGLWVQQPKRRWLLTGVIGLLGIALLLTQSRAGWAAFAVAACVFILLRTARWSFLLVLAAIAAWIVAPASIKARVATALDPKHTSNVYRNNIRVGVLALIQKFWVLGSGLGGKAFTDVYQEFMLSGARAAHAHNTYLQMWAETGIFGLLTILWSLFTVVRRTLVVGAQKLRSPVVAAVAAAMVGVLVHAWAEHIWYNPKLLISFWAVAGLGMGLALGDKEGAKA
ncbi:MAG: hypothetical protein K0R39_1025 [Symbiobacteriaceae bacterium]|jgi:O-antigen ligase|nr:hypothetical protein [Symbiobacteriaceae bacterium]